uniref:EsaB/YukD family protein n=1 Tax=Mycobacterium tuberculosis TaxID=1773 RepID=UPI00202A4831
MPTSDPGLRRVTVHAGAQAVDLTLPAAVPVATLIPSIVDILGDRGASPATAARYQLSALGAPALPNASTHPRASDVVRARSAPVAAQT